MTIEQYSCSKMAVKRGKPKIFYYNRSAVKVYHLKIRYIQAKVVQTMAKMNCKHSLTKEKKNKYGFRTKIKKDHINIPIKTECFYRKEKSYRCCSSFKSFKKFIVISKRKEKEKYRRITRNETHLPSPLLNATLTSVYLSACSSVRMFIKIHTIAQCQIHAVHSIYIFTETD